MAHQEQEGLTLRRRLHAGLVALAIGVACRPAPEGEARPDGPKGSPPSDVPTAWSDLGVPRAGLLRVLPESNEHGFYADYAGHDRAALLAEVSRGLVNAGYSQSCTAVDGLVLGFSNGSRQLALKIDMLPNPSLSLFDENGKEPLLHGLCFGRYRGGPWHRMSQEEKEALARDLEADEGQQVETPAPSTPP